jgi:signal transduction histidine kinase/ActR/RegA family two-component response regulator
MVRANGSFRNYLVVVLVVLIGIAASLAAASTSDHSVKQTNGQLLLGEAAQGGLVLSEFLASTGTPFQKLGSIVTPFGVSPAQFDAAAESVSTSTGSPIALLHEDRGHLSVLTSVGHLHRSFGVGHDDAAITLAAGTANSNFPGMFVADGQNWLEEVYGKGYVPAGFVIYAEESWGKTHSVTKLPGNLFSGANAGLYVGSVGANHLLLQTNRQVPTGAQEALSVITTTQSFNPSAELTAHASTFRSPGNLIVVMSANRSLSGTFTVKFPWILLVGGLSATLIAALLLAITIRRREEALVYVADLKVKNAALDEALSRQAEAEQSLRQAQRMEAVGQLAGGIAHDFNNLLQAIISYSEFLSESMDPGSEMGQDVAEIQKAARRAAELTRQLLVFSRQDVPSPGVLDLNDVVRASERLLRHTIGEDVSFECQTYQEPLHVLADAGEFEQMLMNLVINARDAMPQGGNLLVTTDAVDLNAEQGLRVGLGDGRFARVRVQDSGEGMTPEVAAKAFEPFFTTKETGRGTGLGLAMVYGIASRWGGNASISSVVRKGTTVTVLFPLSSIEPKLGTIDLEPRTSNGDRQMVLLVEDQEGVRRSTARILEAAGYQVLLAESAVEASLVYDSATIDILVTDVIMPGGVSGIDLADGFRLEKPDLPVVFISGYSAEAIAGRGHLTPFSTLVQKPFTPDDLLAALAREIEEEAPASQPS